MSEFSTPVPLKYKFISLVALILIPLSYLYLLSSGYLDWYVQIIAPLFGDIISPHSNNYIQNNDFWALFTSLFYQTLYLSVLCIPMILSCMLLITCGKLIIKKELFNV
jgi:hypothetical protein